MVFVDQPKQEKPPEQQPVQLDVPLKGFQTVVAPDVIPTNIPPVNLQEHFDPKDSSGTGVEGRSEEHTSELQSRLHLVCRLLLGKQRATMLAEICGHGSTCEAFHLARLKESVAEPAHA